MRVAIGLLTTILLGSLGTPLGAAHRLPVETKGPTPEQRLALLQVAGEELRDAILRRDIKWVLSNLRPRGVLIVDEPYSKERIRKALSDPGSWLYSYLFGAAQGTAERMDPGKLSVRGYLLAAKDLQVHVTFRTIRGSGNMEYGWVEYRSSNFEDAWWRGTGFAWRNGRWWLSDLFPPD